jgi:hypothetical protein
MWHVLGVLEKALCPPACYLLCSVESDTSTIASATFTAANGHRFMLKIPTLAVLLSMFLFGQANAQFVAVYERPQTATYLRAASNFQQSRLLERLAEQLNSTVRIPTRVQLVLDECGQVNAFYQPSTRAVVLCHEMIEKVGDGVRRDFRNSTFEFQADTVAGALMFILHHEVGHALVHVLALPIFGREEDAVDGIATFMQLTGPSRFHGILGAAWFNDRMISGVADQSAFSDEHSLGPQRKFNILCLAVGSDPGMFSAVAAAAGLTKQRAERCPSEFVQLESSVQKLLSGNLVPSGR